jgi:hypothetical protein
VVFAKKMKKVQIVCMRRADRLKNDAVAYQKASFEDAIAHCATRHLEVRHLEWMHQLRIQPDNPASDCLDAWHGVSTHQRYDLGLGI